MTKEKNEVAIHDQATAPMAPIESYGAFAGLGHEPRPMTARDIPIVKIAQRQSPEVDKGDSKYQSHLEVGDMFNSVTKERIDQPLLFLPCQEVNAWVEWVSRDKGGGWVGAHPFDHMPPSKPMIDPKTGKELRGKRVMANGNELIDTTYWLGFQLDTFDGSPIEPLTIPFNGSKFVPLKEIQAKFRKIVTASGKKPPLFSFRVLITTFDDERTSGKFWNYQIRPAAADPTGKRIAIPTGNTRECMLSYMVDGEVNPVLVAGNKAVEDLKSGKIEIAYGSDAADDDVAGGAGGAGEDPFQKNRPKN